MVDLGGSLAVASRGLFATGVSTDLSGKARLRCIVFGNSSANAMSTVTYLASGGKIGDIIKAEVTCDKCTLLLSLPPFPHTLYAAKWRE
jgi:acyl-coenzyme A thioesterase 13